MTMPSTMRATGAPLNRLDGVQKVTGAAKYSYEYPVAGVTYIVPVQSTIARGRVSSIDASAARALPGVLAVLSHENAPRLAPPRDDQDLAVFQSDAVAYRGQFVAAIRAETLETARQAASMVAVRYEEQPHDVVLRADRGDLFTPEYVPQKPFGFYPADSAHGDVEAALAAAPVSLDHTYTTPAEHHNPMEPHTTLAIWSDDGTGESVTVYDTCQGGVVETRRHRHCVWAFVRARTRHRALRWRRVWIPGIYPPVCHPRRHGRARRRPAGEAGADAAADGRAGRGPLAQPPTHSSRRPARRPPAG